MGQSVLARPLMAAYTIPGANNNPKTNRNKIAWIGLEALLLWGSLLTIGSPGKVCHVVVQYIVLKTLCKCRFLSLPLPSTQYKI